MRFHGKALLLPHEDTQPTRYRTSSLITPDASAHPLPSGCPSDSPGCPTINAHWWGIPNPCPSATSLDGAYRLCLKIGRCLKKQGVASKVKRFRPLGLSQFIRLWDGYKALNPEIRTPPSRIT